MLNQPAHPEPRPTAAPDASLTTMQRERRVWTAVGASLALLAIGILIATVAMLRLSGEAVRATNSEIQYATAMTAAALNAKAIANDERGYLLSGDEEFLVQMDGRIPLAREAFTQAMEFADEAQRARLIEIHELFDYWLTLVRDEIALYQAGDVEAAQAASVGRTREVRHEYERLVTEASLVQSGVPRAQATIASVSGLALTILLGYLVISTLIALALGAWVTAGMRGDDADEWGALPVAQHRESGHPEIQRP